MSHKKDARLIRVNWLERQACPQKCKGVRKFRVYAVHHRVLHYCSTSPPPYCSHSERPPDWKVYEEASTEEKRGKFRWEAEQEQAYRTIIKKAIKSASNGLHPIPFFFYLQSIPCTIQEETHSNFLRLSTDQGVPLIYILSTNNGVTARHRSRSRLKVLLSR